jgi:polyisoprenoid-binding protein YceI
LGGARGVGAVFVRAIVVAGLMAGCASPVPRLADGAGEQPAEFPDAYYRQAAARGQPVYEVDPASSLVVIEVRRGGTLAHLGHDHVVASHDLRGYMAPADGRADLYLRLDRLVVDERDLRAEAQFDTQPSDEAIAATRTNMLEKLGAHAHPWALVAVRDAAIDATGSRMNATLTLNGNTRAMDLSPQIVLAAGEVGVDGRVALEQTNFGITPFSILGGALRVQDQVAVRFRIRARRIPP